MLSALEMQMAPASILVLCRWHAPVRGASEGLAALRGDAAAGTPAQRDHLRGNDQSIQPNVITYSPVISACRSTAVSSACCDHLHSSVQYIRQVLNANEGLATTSASWISSALVQAMLTPC